MTAAEGGEPRQPVGFQSPPPPPRAVILAAGKGDRLHPLTADLPKCLVEVGGQPMLERALRALARQGISEAVIVIGYRGELIRDRIGSCFAGIEIRYVEAPDYATTNNIRSLWDARAYLGEDTLLLEADVAFDETLVSSLLAEPRSSAAVAPYRRGLSGTVVCSDAGGRITNFLLGADQDERFDLTQAFKTVNIYLLRKELLNDHVLPRLCREVEAGNVQQYYETVFRDCVAEHAVTDLMAVDVSQSRWYEVDDLRDLDAAEFLFLDREAQFDRISELHGSYWRYGFVDHSYLYNMHFPPPAMLASFQENLPEIITNYPVGQSELARLVASWTGAAANQLAIANGGAELIKVLGQLSPRLTISTPSFNEYEEVIPSAQLNRVPLHPPSFELDIDAFAESAIASRSDIAVVVTPNNPTAVSVPRDDVVRLARRLEPMGCRLIVDESFIEFSRAGCAGSVESMVELHPNLVVLKSMSKVFGVAGLRLGYLLCADIEFMETIRDRLPIWNVNGLAEGFLRTLGRYRREFERSCELTQKSCRELYQQLCAMPGIEPVEPDANFVLCRLTGPSLTGPEAARRLYVEHNILIKDCAAKSMPDADRYVRIASRTSAENCRLVEALAAII